MSETIGFIGLGVMGAPMAKNLLKAGHRLVVHNRSRPAVDELVAAGATAATSTADVARQATVVITMLPDTPDVERVITGADGVLSALQPGTVVVDMSSISPAATVQLAKQISAKGGLMLDAPVSGGEIGAINATLSIIVGGDDDRIGDDVLDIGRRQPHLRHLADEAGFCVSTSDWSIFGNRRRWSPSIATPVRGKERLMRRRYHSVSRKGEP